MPLDPSDPHTVTLALPGPKDMLPKPPQVGRGDIRELSDIARLQQPQSARMSLHDAPTVTGDVEASPRSESEQGSSNLRTRGGEDGPKQTRRT
eukprot:6813651-Alexandrium_andersonii.AAC.2